MSLGFPLQRTRCRDSTIHMLASDRLAHTKVQQTRQYDSVTLLLSGDWMRQNRSLCSFLMLGSWTALIEIIDACRATRFALDLVRTRVRDFGFAKCLSAGSVRAVLRVGDKQFSSQAVQSYGSGPSKYVKDWGRAGE